MFKTQKLCEESISTASIKVANSVLYVPPTWYCDGAKKCGDYQPYCTTCGKNNNFCNCNEKTCLPTLLKIDHQTYIDSQRAECVFTKQLNLNNNAHLPHLDDSNFHKRMYISIFNIFRYIML